CDLNSFEPSTKTRCCRNEGHPCGDSRDCCDNLCCLEPGLCGTACFSDRNLKANFGSVDSTDMLQRVRDLPIATWNYISDDHSVRHIGPMAQDFAALFGVGADDRHIHPLDGQGVALAAIQGLLSQLQDMREENDRLAARVARLETATWSSLLVRGRSSLAQYRN
ncbi:MAG: tail fiber domain-containing protein, partial [Thermomicrobiales bacterium]